MKPYFAKYLPEEGEIKEGDCVQVKSHNSDNIPLLGAGAVFTVLRKDNSTGREYLEDGKGTLCPAENAQKVKLFLCSRDIQVGDSACAKGTFHNIAGFEWKEHHAKEYNNNADGYYYKVIGEISPEAVWVKEGDEFDEDDLVFKRVDRENGGGWKYVEVEDTAGFPTIVEIKNPSCKHFH
jgi:hypothetical protein